MPTTQELKARVEAEIDRQGQQLITTTKTILNNPEPGFREVKTARTVAESFQSMGIPYEDGIGITGLKGMLRGGASGPTVAVMGELDSLKVLGHPHADPETTAAHACGHHCQIGMMLAVAAGLTGSGVMDDLSGRVALIAVPAEEYIEIEYRDDLRREGKLEFLGGKPEFIRLGALDDVDLAMMTHTSSNRDEGKIAIGGTNNGIVAKRIQFNGRASHAGGAPHAGVNALNAAMIALNAIHAQRETYRDYDTIRIHPIITRGGASVNSVPADVRMETFVRGRSVEAFLAASDKVDRALRAGAMAVGGSVDITTLPGYMPIQNDETMLQLYRANAAGLVGEAEHRSSLGSTSPAPPTWETSQPLHARSSIPTPSGATGTGHAADYLIAGLRPSRVINRRQGDGHAPSVDLLADGAAGAKEVRAIGQERSTVPRCA